LADGLIAVYDTCIYAKIVSNIGMSDLQNSNQPVSATSRAPKTWDFMETTFVALIAYAVLVLTVDLSVDVILSMQDGV